MLFRAFQYAGIFFIVLFSAFSILLSTSEKDFTKNINDKSFFITYASFFEDRFFDLRMKFTLNKKEIDQQMVLVAIDDNSLNKIGRWPWSRTIIAKVVDKLKIFGAKVVAFDVFNSEPELACISESPDKILSKSIKSFQEIPGNKIIFPYSVDTKEINLDANKKFNEELFFKEIPDQLLNFMLDTKQSQGANLEENLISKKVYPIPELANSDIGISHIEAYADSDGVFRHYPIVANIDSLYLPSFSLQAYQFFTGDKPVLEIPTSEMAILKTKKGTAYLNFSGETKVRWLGGVSNFPMISILDVLKSNDNDRNLKKTFR